MATVQLNNTIPIRFEAGGILRINDGTDDFIIRNKEEGTLRITNAGRQVLAYQENGANQTPLEGDEQTPRLEITVKHSKDDGVQDIYTNIIRKRPSPATGRVFVFPSVQVDVPDYATASAGRRFAFTNAYIIPEECRVEAGVEFDMLHIVMHAVSMGEPTTY